MGAEKEHEPSGGVSRVLWGARRTGRVQQRPAGEEGVASAGSGGGELEVLERASERRTEDGELNCHFANCARLRILPWPWYRPGAGNKQEG
jgi:hypothetical protein